MNSPAQTSGAPVKYAKVDAESDGANEIVAAVTGKKIRVVGYCLTTDVTGVITLQDDAGTPVVHAKFHGVAGTAIPYSGGPAAPAFETAAGVALDLSNAAGTDTYGHVAYQLV